MKTLLTNINLLLIYIALFFVNGCAPNPYQEFIDMEFPDVRYVYTEIKGEGGYYTTMIPHFQQDLYSISTVASIPCTQVDSCDPDYAIIYISSAMSIWHLDPSATLYILADGERFSYTDDSPGFSAGIYHMAETASVIIPIDEFQNIASADSVRAQLNNFEIDFSWETRRYYRDLISALHERNPEKYFSEY